jgi:hypothetical protein
MAVEEELGGPMTITAVSWMRTGEGDDWGVYRESWHVIKVNVRFGFTIVPHLCGAPTWRAWKPCSSGC